jgi:Glycosyl transferase family 2
VSDELTILVAARDEAPRIGATVRALRERFPDARVIVADDGSRDGTAGEAEAAAATVLRLPRRGKGQALSLAERSAPPGRLLLVDADLEGDPAPLLDADADLAEREGGGFGIAKRCGRALVRLIGGVDVREPLSGQRAYSPAGRAAAFPLAPGFGCEVRGTIDVARAGLRVVEVELPLRHRATGRDLGGFAHRGRQLADLLLGVGPLGVNHRGLRVPLVGWVLALGPRRSVSAVALVGLADDLWSGEERGFREHLASGRTTGVLKLVAIPALGLLATRRLSGGLLVGLAANALNQLDTKPGRALKAFLLGAAVVRGPARAYAAGAVLLLPYDLREMAMLGDGGSNALGAVLGLGSVDRFTGRGRFAAIAALAGLTLLGEKRSLGAFVERTPGLRELDALGRPGT